ncbi:tripartite tricarboxylate transporter substrate binding protein [Bradyrhizobium prioriisuperbiae]|uniref:Bug family tripartite tricarboxylate transporter substrate binding protein n=1 Tax=Bradyrhizobium prioriisuperbiae TaxID=2854389 RepID=UPI0028EF0597|nr:tripartite tricarboxylate transporter substrate binding protein [Bradyrhizobium prioritasuperba]
MTGFQPSRRTALLGGAAVAFSNVGRAFAQHDSLKGPITIVVPFAAGGATDIVTRLVGKKLGERLGVSVVIENAGGAGGVVGATRVARATPDGTSLLMGTVATHAINPLMAQQPPYDPVNDFTPISLVATVPNVLLVGPQVKVTNVTELIAMLKAEPGRYNYGSSGNGTPPHLSGELFKVMAKVEMTHVPYRGGSPAMTDLVGGQIPILFDVLTGAANFVREKTVRALAVTTKTRSPSFPDLPTVAESGLPGYETYTWNAVFGPARMPAPLVALLSSEISQAVADPEVKQRLTELSAEPVGGTPEALKAQVQAELAKWEPVIKAAGLK